MSRLHGFYGALVAATLLTACNASADKTAKTKQTENTEKQAETEKDTAQTTHEQTTTMQLSATAEDSAGVERLLNQLVHDGKRLAESELILRVARSFIGTPYVAHTLDRNKEEQLTVNLREMDCTTFLENVAAIALCANRGKTSFGDFANLLRQIRYRGGKISYENRLHYYQWWVTDNEKMGLVREIHTPNPPFTEVQKLKINYMSQNSNAYDMLRNHPERISRIKEMEDKTNGTNVRYIPKKELKNSKLLRTVIRDGDLIAIVTNKKNLDTTHLGIAVWHHDGLHLINASSLKKNQNSVIEPEETLYDYLAERPHNPGIRVARLCLSKIK